MILIYLHPAPLFVGTSGPFAGGFHRLATEVAGVSEPNYAGFSQESIVANLAYGRVVRNNPKAVRPENVGDVDQQGSPAAPTDRQTGSACQCGVVAVTSNAADRLVL